MSITIEERLALVSELVAYLSGPNISHDDLVQFLTKRTFAGCGAKAVYLMNLTNDSHLELIASYGQSEEQLRGWSRISLSEDVPGTDAIKEDRGVYLTKRQIVILELISEQMTNMQIARALGYSESTIRHESMRIYQLLQVNGRREAVAEGRKLGVIK